MNKYNGGFNGERNGEQVTDLGYLLGYARMSRRLTLTQVASAIGTSSYFLSHVEHGYRNLPAKYIVSISRVLRLDRSVVAAMVLQETFKFKELAKLAK